MKVALVLFNWFPHGGLQRDCLGIANSLIKRGLEVDVICMSWEGSVPEGINPVIPSFEVKNKVAARKAFAEFVLQITAAEDYLTVLGFNRLPGLDYYFAADTCFAWKARRERSWLYRLAPRSRQYLAFEEAVFGSQSDTKILMLSPGQKDEYLACYPLAGKRMINIPPGIERNRMAGEDAPELRQSLRLEFDITAEQLLILQVGSGFPIKGVERSLAALASLPEALGSRTRLFIVGRDDSQRYEKIAEKMGIAANVSFFKSRDDLPRFYQGADLLLHPSVKESAGMVLIEAIVAGLPVLTTASCGYAFHVRQAQAGVVITDPFTQQALNEALQKMLESKDKSRWRTNGIAYGQKENLYDMPDAVASMLLNAIGEANDGN